MEIKPAWLLEGSFMNFASDRGTPRILTLNLHDSCSALLQARRPRTAGKRRKKNA